MQNTHGDGIICDFCLDIYKVDFLYYSLDFKDVFVRDCSHQYGTETYSADLCEQCMEAFRNRVTEVYKPSKKNEINCDITGRTTSGSEFKYYKCSVSRAKVTLSGRPYVCSGCGGILENERASCAKCKEGVGVRRADVDVDTNYLELNFGQDIYQKFIGHIKTMKEYLEKDNERIKRSKSV